MATTIRSRLIFCLAALDFTRSTHHIGEVGGAGFLRRGVLQRAAGSLLLRLGLDHVCNGGNRNQEQCRAHRGKAGLLRSGRHWCCLLL